MSMLEIQMVSERLQNILRILENYHRLIIQKNSLDSQDPQATVQITKHTLAKHGDMIEEYLRWRTIPLIKDEDLLQCIDELSKYVDPWDVQVSSLAPEWCRLMFKEYPMVISSIHIKTIYKNSGIADGEVS